MGGRSAPGGTLREGGKIEGLGKEIFTVQPQKKEFTLPVVKKILSPCHQRKFYPPSPVTEKILPPAIEKTLLTSWGYNKFNVIVGVANARTAPGCTYPSYATGLWLIISDSIIIRMLSNLMPKSCTGNTYTKNCYGTI